MPKRRRKTTTIDRNLQGTTVQSRWVFPCFGNKVEEEEEEEGAAGAVEAEAFAETKPIAHLTDMDIPRSVHTMMMRLRPAVVSEAAPILPLE